MTGNGKGPGANGLVPPPRDPTRGVYRYRSTPSGSVPLDSDLVRTVAEGLPGTAMPGWRDLLAPEEIGDVAAYIKTLSPRFGRKPPKAAIEVPGRPPVSAQSVAAGANVWTRAGCGRCHGGRGRGDGWAKADELRDDTGHAVRAPNLTGGVFRSGRSAEDLFLVIRTGLDGSPMPSYADALTPRRPTTW